MATLYVVAFVDMCHGVQCLIAESKLAIAVKALDYSKNEAESPEFLAINPFGVCPTLQEEGHVLWESHTILRYLCNKFNLSQWYSQSDPLARARIDDVLDWKHRVLHPSIRKSLFGSDKQQGQEELKANIAELESVFLKGGKFINDSSEPTIADLSIRPALNWLPLFGLPMTKGVQDYTARFDARVPSYLEASASQAAFAAQMKARFAAETDTPKEKEPEKAAEKGKEKEKVAEKPKEKTAEKGKEKEKGGEKAKEQGKEKERKPSEKGGDKPKSEKEDKVNKKEKGEKAKEKEKERKPSEKGGDKPKSENEEKPNKKDAKKGGKESERKPSEKGVAAKKDSPALVGDSKLDDKRVKACDKEGGKKGQDMAGMSTFGSHYFCAAMEEPKGELEYLEICMKASNREVDPDAEDRKGGAGDIGKLFLTSNDTNVAMICHVPKERTELKLTEWFGHVMASVGATRCGEQTEFMMRAQVAADPDNGKFTIKMKDVAIGAAFQFLRERGLVLDDSDDDTNYADAAGINLNAAPGADY